MRKERIYKYNNSEIVIRFGDIVESDTDVIVCSDDYMLSAGGGASLAVRKACGDIIFHDIQKKANANIGDVVVTTAGNLPHKFLFHCITIGKDNLSETTSAIKMELEEYVIQHSISKCLRLLTALDLTSIAVPCIGAGMASFDFERVGRIMSAVISDFLLKTNKSYHIEIYLLGDRTDLEMIDYISFFEQFALRVPATTNYTTTLPAILNDYKPEIANTSKPRYDVFISYSRLDKDKADVICRYLDNYSIGYWIDRESVHHGDNFKVEIIEAIQASKILIFISSANSNKSPNTVKEVSIAEKYGKIIIPIRIDNSAYNSCLEYDLCNKDWMDFQEGIDYEASAKKLYKSLRFYINKDL